MSYRGFGGYKGDLRCGKPHGKGVFRTANGDVYEGEFLDGEKSGVGVLTYSDGSRYSGDFKKDRRHGKGSYIFTNGDLYEGNWYMDKAHGWGLYRYVGGGTYVDDWRMGISSGNHASRNIRKLRRGFHRIPTQEVSTQAGHSATESSENIDTTKKNRPKSAPILHIQDETPESELRSNSPYRLGIKDFSVSSHLVTSPIKPKPKLHTASIPGHGAVYPPPRNQNISIFANTTKHKSRVIPGISEASSPGKSLIEGESSSTLKSPTTNSLTSVIAGFLKRKERTNNLFDPDRLIHNNNFNTSLKSPSKMKLAYVYQVTT